MSGFQSTLLTLNLNKIKCVYFTTKLNMLKNINVIHGGTQIHNTSNVKFLGLIIDSTLSWKDHINQLAVKSSLAAYTIRTLSFVMSQ
jgi:hypothetical protein